MASPTTNTAWTIPSTASSLSHLTQEHRPIPTPGPNQVLIRLTAATLNYRDLLIITHNPEYPGPHKHGLVFGSDAAGVIHSAHSTSKWANKVGTKVMLHPCAWESGGVQNLDRTKVFGSMTEDGVMQGWKIENDVKVVEVGDGLSAAEWACLPSAGVTAWSAIREGMDGKLNGEQDAWKGSFTDKRLKGKTILTQGTGGTSCFAIQVSSLVKIATTTMLICRSRPPSAPPSSLPPLQMPNSPSPNPLAQLTPSTTSPHLTGTKKCSVLLTAWASIRSLKMEVPRHCYVPSKVRAWEVSLV
jgi:NADPH:quinone reductase-like Zn-dependent oxidoreductase